MRRNITKYITLAATIMVLLAGCQREELAEEFGPGDGQIRYSVTTVGLKSTAAETKSTGSLSLVSKDGKMTVPVTCEVVEGINLGGGNAETKGELINTSGSDAYLPDDIDFTVSAYKGSTLQFENKTATKRGDYWLMDPPQYWPLSTKLTFYAYTNAGDNTVSQTATSQTLTYTVTEDVAAHKDLMLGYYKGDGGNKGIAEMRFDHPLTAVRFKKGLMEDVKGIRSISISRLASGGTVTMDAYGDIGNWTVAGTENYEAEVTLSPSGAATTLSVDADSFIGMDADGKYNGAFLLIPQTLSEHNVTVTAVLSTDSGDVTVYADITSGKWEVGKTNTYTLGYTGGDKPDLLPGKFSVSETEYVQFSRGNLFCTDNGTTASPRYTFNFERNQYDFRNHPGKASLLNGVYSTSSGTPANTSGAFQWSVSAAVPGQDYGAFGTEYPGTPADDATIDWGQAIGGNWYTMTREEMSYMVGYGSPEQKRPNYENLRKISKIVFSDFSVNGYVFAPDNYDFTSHPLKSSYTESEWVQAEKEYGLVFFSCAGFGNNAAAAGLVCRYYLSKNPGDHLYLGIDDDDYIGSSAGEYYCTSVRLVQKKPKVDYVEIGGLKWATCNVGANTPKDYGWYFSWAGTTGYVRDGSKWVTAQGGSELSGGFSWENTPYHTGSVQTTNWNKYIPTDKSTYWTGGGSPDNKLSLDIVDDAVRANLGGSWRMPTQADFQTLYQACGGTGLTALPSANPGKGIYWVSNTQTYISDYNGVAGILFCDGTSKLFFVAAGYGAGNNLSGGGTEGRYWAGTVYSTTPQNAYRLGFQIGNVSPENVNARNQGFPVRPVHD